LGTLRTAQLFFWGGGVYKKILMFCKNIPRRQERCEKDGCKEGDNHEQRKKKMVQDIYRKK